MMSVNQLEVTSRTSERCTLGNGGDGICFERDLQKTADSVGNRSAKVQSFKRNVDGPVPDCKTTANHPDSSKNAINHAFIEKRGAGDFGNIQQRGITDSACRESAVVCRFRTHTSRDNGRIFDKGPCRDSGSLISDKPPPLDCISERDSDKHTASVRVTIGTTERNNNIVNSPLRVVAAQNALRYCTSTEVAHSEVGDISATGCRAHERLVTGEGFRCSARQTGDCTKPTVCDFSAERSFDRGDSMGNIQPKRSDTANSTKAEVKGKHLATTPSANSDAAEERKTRAIPEVIISDASMETDLGMFSVREPVDAPADDEIDELSAAAKDAAALGRSLKSSDSAYSSDSRCTSMDSGTYGASRADEGCFADQLSPPALSADAKSLGSSSSSSSSPAHSVVAGASSNLPSDQTLRVISDYGLQRKLSSSSGSSYRSSLSFEESEDDMLGSDNEVQRKAQSSWTKIRRMVIWSPFMQSFKKKYPWVQLAGHAGNFQPGEEGCILKKYCHREAECLSQLARDEHLSPYAPDYHGVVDKDGERYTRMQDLLLAFDCPSVMDCKMGLRTYLEDELVKAKIKPRLRHDMYKKMTEISPEEPTAEEHRQKAVTKPRYMQWREHVSSSSNLGFRIEGIKKGDKEPSKDYKLTKTMDQVKSAFKYFIDDKIEVLEKYIVRLKEIRGAAEKSEFFMSHEVIGSSLLFVHDQTGQASSWMIDFGKTTKLPGDDRLTHRENWVEGNREDGYLLGMDNLISIFEEIAAELKEQSASGATVTTSNPTDNNMAAAWALSSQSSGESYEQCPPDSPSWTPSDSSRERGASPRGSLLKRQAAATEPAASNGDADVTNAGVANVTNAVVASSEKT